MEGKLVKNQYPNCVNFKCNINGKINPKLKDSWSRIIRKCKPDLTLALLDDIQATYNGTKASIA